MPKQYRITKRACYLSNISMSVVVNISPLLFITFHRSYGISYTLLGLLVLINFCTQLCIDLLFSFFSHRFDIPKTVRLMPLLTVLGLAVYAVFPMLFPENAYAFLVLGTVIFSLSGGLAEVLISPVIAALPSDSPERDMSLAHSSYAWGVVGVVLCSTVFLQIFGTQYWYILVLLWTLLPLTAFLLFMKADIPALNTPKNSADAAGLFRDPTLLLCIACIFLGGASENTMSQWCSGYLEAALGIDKIWGDVFGTAVFAVTLGLGRTLYARFGKNIRRVLIAGFSGAVVCYLAAALSPFPVLGLLACAMTGFCVSMLWPGTIIRAEQAFPAAGVSVFALLAAGGDLGSSAAPQLVGSITDAVSASSLARTLSLPMTGEQLGFKAGLLAAAVFPLAGIVIACILNKKEK